MKGRNATAYLHCMSYPHAFNIFKATEDAEVLLFDLA